MLVEVSYECFWYVDFDDEDVLVVVLVDLLVLDVVLFEGGVFVEFFEVCGLLLFDDEWLFVE